MGSKRSKASAAKAKVQEAAAEHPLRAFAGAAFASLGAILGFGALTGGAELARRNHEWMLIGAVLGVLSGSLVSVVGATIRSGWLLVMGAAATFAGLVLASVAVFDREIGRPSVSVSVSEAGSLLTASFEAGGLPSNEELQLWIVALPGGETLYRSSFGPDPSGDVKRTLEFPLPGAGFDRLLLRAWRTGSDPGPCIVSRERSEPITTGCVELPLPSRNSRPRLVVSTEGRMLVAALASSGVTDAHALGFRITAVSPVQRMRLYGSNLAPQNGRVEETIKVSVPERFATVCVEAMVVPARDTRFARGLATRKRWGVCPQRRSQRVAWSRLTLPG